MNHPNFKFGHHSSFNLPPNSGDDLLFSSRGFTMKNSIPLKP
jgi:hypothetical protein